MDAPTLARIALWLTIIVGVSMVVFADVDTERSGCSFDHVASDGEKNVTVKICANISHEGDGDVVGLSYPHNDTILVEDRDFKDITYIHELGHQSGYGHVNDTIMNARLQREKPDCAVGPIEHDLANEWDTIEIKHIGPCKFVETPYGQVW